MLLQEKCVMMALAPFICNPQKEEDSDARDICQYLTVGFIIEHYNWTYFHAAK